MQTISISDELYQKLRNFIVDPFEDTPEAVVGRLVEIATKAKNRWTPWEQEEVQMGMGAPMRRNRMPRPPIEQDADEESPESMVVL